MNFPSGKYDIIYADPPWDYRGARIGTGDHVTKPYSGMTINELSELPVAEISEENSLLFMWAVSPELTGALEVGESWGFTYKTVGFVWDKQSPVTSYYTLSQVEMCLVFKRGKIPQPRGKRNIRQFLSCGKGRHSEKPYEIRHRITEMFPEQSRIELFARQRFPGWDCWGNEIDTEPTLF